MRCETPAQGELERVSQRDVTLANHNRNQAFNSRSRSKKKLSAELLPYFNHSWTCGEHNSLCLFEDYPMPYRSEKVRNSQVAALCSILGNIDNGKCLIVPNFSRISASSFGYSREIFSNVMGHLGRLALVVHLPDDEVSGPYTRGTLTFSRRIMKYRPAKRYFLPEGTILLSKGGKEKKTVAKIDTIERRQINGQLRAFWDFLKQQEIKSNITDAIFNLCNEYQVEVEKKEPLVRPDENKFLPYSIFNSSDLTQGGRLYGAFWIGCKSYFRRLITINGHLTCDIDGRAMHVQLLYKLKGIVLPPGDPYLFEDKEVRRIAKNLMMLMLNTKEYYQPAKGREKVIRTYRGHFGKYPEASELDKYIDDLEAYHWQILDELYQPNWGRLQKTEAAIMLKIIEHGMADDVVILPVHDGCLCPRKDRDRVLEYFKREGIIAAENEKHLLPLPLDDFQEALRAVRSIKQKAA